MLRSLGQQEKTREILTDIASQFAWYGMENGAKAENGKKLAEKENGPQPEMGEKWRTNMAKKWD